MSRSRKSQTYEVRPITAQDNTGVDRITTPPEELRSHPYSIADAGKLFRWNGRLCQGITCAQAPFLRQLFRDGIVKELVKRGLLIESEPYNRALEGYAEVVSHPGIPFISYPDEWSAAMFRDAALTILDLAIELSRRGLTLGDAHPWNVLFDGSKPVYVDLTSIGPQKNGSAWSAYDEFCRFCYYPLILMSQGQERIARALLPEYQGVLRSELLTMVRGSGPSRFVLSKILRRGFRSIQSSFLKESSKSALALLKQVRRDMEEIRLPSYQRRHRSRRNQVLLAAPADHEWTSRPLTLRKVLTKLNPASVLDLSRGSLWTSTVPAIMGFNVVSLDADAARVSALYQAASEKNLSILPLLVDFMKPAPSLGYSDHYSLAAPERLKCDLVLALGLTPGTATENQLDFDLIAGRLALFSKRWLLVECDVSKSLKAQSGIVSLGSPSRKLQVFIDALAKRFSDISLVSSGADMRALLLCEK